MSYSAKCSSWRSLIYVLAASCTVFFYAAIAEGELIKVRELATLPDSALGCIDGKCAQSTIDVVKSAFSLKRPLTVEDVFDLKIVE